MWTGGQVAWKRDPTLKNFPLASVEVLSGLECFLWKVFLNICRSGLADVKQKLSALFVDNYPDRSIALKPARYRIKENGNIEIQPPAAIFGSLCKVVACIILI